MYLCIYVYMYIISIITTTTTIIIITIINKYVYMLRDGQTYPKRFLPELNKTQ